MRAQAALILLGLLCEISSPVPDEPNADKPKGRFVEGTVVAAPRQPVGGAMVLFCRAGAGLAFVKDATATTDARGRYRADLTMVPWSTGALKATVLAPGFAVNEQTITPGTQLVKADFQLKTQPWKETQIRLEDQSHRPVAGVEVNFSVGQVDWSRAKTDAHGSCRIAMARDMGVRLSAEPEGYRPIKAVFHVVLDGADGIVLPVLPPYRGRVVGPDGRPASGVAVGRWIGFVPSGAGSVSPFIGRDAPITDGEGRFQVAPPVDFRTYAANPGLPEMEALCFADETFGRVALQIAKPDQATEPIEVKLRAARPVRIPIAAGALAPKSKAELESIVLVPPRLETPLDQGFYFILRERAWKGGPAGALSQEAIEETLPGGVYRINLELRDTDTDKVVGTVMREFVVPNGDGPLELPPLQLRTPIYQQMAGKPAPEIDATDLDSGKRVRLADFRGKVVVLDFWGHWCGPCVGAMPGLAELHREFEGRPLVILALHDQSVQSRAEYDRKIAVPRQRSWGGRDLPFRVLLDRPDPETAVGRYPEGNGTTVKRYGVLAFPTVLVIDRDGTFVEYVSEHDRLKLLLRQLVEKAEAG